MGGMVAWVLVALGLGKSLRAKTIEIDSVWCSMKGVISHLGVDFLKGMLGAGVRNTASTSSTHNFTISGIGGAQYTSKYGSLNILLCSYSKTSKSCFNTCTTMETVLPE